MDYHMVMICFLTSFALSVRCHGKLVFESSCLLIVSLIHAGSSSSCVGGYPNGANWTGGKCLLCTCRDGITECAPDLEHCCYRNDLRNISQYYEHGEEWREKCSVCICNNGVEQCPLYPCPDVIRVPESENSTCGPNPHYVIDECGCKKLRCRYTCTDEEGLSDRDTPGTQGRQYHHKQKWTKYRGKTGVCETCLCLDGEKACINQSADCSETLDMHKCHHSYKKIEEGHCCPTWHCPKHEGCHMSEWGEWGKCNRSCGYGISRRYRKITSRRKNATCPSTSEKRHCILRHCPGKTYNDTGMDMKKAVHLHTRRGCQNVHNMKSMHCSITKCLPYGLTNKPLYITTIKVEMRCKRNESVHYHYELFAKIGSCGCLP